MLHVFQNNIVPGEGCTLIFHYTYVGQFGGFKMLSFDILWGVSEVRSDCEIVGFSKVNVQNKNILGLA